MRARRDDADIIVVGGGVAGLEAARRLVAARMRVIVVEARPRPGGRIDTRHEAGWPAPLEGGAEFVHGRPPALVRALRDAGAAMGEHPHGHVIARAGKLRRADRSWAAAQDLIGRLPDEDRAYAEVQRRPAFHRGASPEVLALAAGFVEGFNAADPARVSARGLRRQSEAEEAEEGDRLFRVRQGYDALVAHLARPLARAPGVLALGAVAREIRWGASGVEVHARGAWGGALGPFRAAAALVTLPIGVLKARPPAPGAVRFVPALPAGKRDAIRRLEMGTVVKVVLRFRSAFWERGAPPLRGLSFLHTPGGALPTWWVQRPLTDRVLVGWSAGPSADRLRASVAGGGAALVGVAVRSLAASLGMSRPALAAALEDARVFDWAADPFARGAYSWLPVGALDAPAELAVPVGGRLFFAGEATDTDGDGGTVHGALATGSRAANQIIAALG
jgi:monoamine oxidase